MQNQIEIHLPQPHDKQALFLDSQAKRKVIRGGRRGGKTVGVAIKAVIQFLAGVRILYAAPTMEQFGRFWSTINHALYHCINAKVFRKNESEHYIELPGTEQRIKAKTAWNADSLRGDYADLLILDEFQLMNEDTWDKVGAPMLLDNDGDAIFLYTPPTLKSRSVSKANDPRHAAKLFRKAKALKRSGSDRWDAFHFTSMDNPHLSQAALREITEDMSQLAYRLEILAEDIDEAPGALWTRQIVDKYRITTAPEQLDRIVVAVDPSTTSTGDEAGIIVAGSRYNQGYLLADESLQGSPLTWANKAVKAYRDHQANLIVAEVNQGGEMVETTIHQVAPDIPVKMVHASRGKQTRAEPISAKGEKGLIHHVGNFPMLEDELCLWTPGDPSPNRLDAYVWAMTELLSKPTIELGFSEDRHTH